MITLLCIMYTFPEKYDQRRTTTLIKNARKTKRYSCKILLKFKVNVYSRCNVLVLRYVYKSVTINNYSNVPLIRFIIVHVIKMHTRKGIIYAGSNTVIYRVQ